ncbi:MAG: polyphosphate kinase 2 family protein [Pyrinomonadaceae bacterium]|nr:polyphosphate kinase 2 family protein [Pyrinomonadaceae bacterium]
MSYAHRIEDKGQINLKDFDPKSHGSLRREEATEKMARLTEELVELQELLYAANQRSVLVVLQGRDTSGKDGVIRHVFGPLNSQSCEVASFKVPTAKELSHDFLWRIHTETPATGQIKIFNRSHYEDVLVARVHNLVPSEVWQRRYDHINNFERLLADSGTIILKFYLHISREEQEERLRKREQDATKFWKLSVGDWRERERWDAYTAAYEDVLNQCSAPNAPWFVVLADRKWFRDVAIAEAMADALRPHKEDWLRQLEETGKRELAAIEEFRKSGK